MNDPLQHKLQQWEAQPPAGAWESIRQVLEKEPASLGSRLAQYSETPAPQNWDTIHNQLGASVVPFSTRKAWLQPHYRVRLVAAAALLIMVAAGIITYTTSRPSSTVARTSPAPITMPTTGPSIANPERQKKQSSAPTTLPGTPPVTTGTVAKTAATAGAAAPKRYLTISNENGDQVRLSKKVYPVFDCADNATARIKTRCKENIESMQQKMASLMASPTADFAGLVDMIKTLEEN